MKGAGAARRRRWIALAALGIVVLIAMGAWTSMEPTNDRVWKREHAVLPVVIFDGDQVEIRGIRNFSYFTADSFSVDYYDRTYDLREISSVWFVVSVFNPNRRGLAHPFLTFGFDSGDFLTISIEARQERGESYSLTGGVFRRFEVIYVLGDERDVIGTRAIQRDDEVYLYPVRASREKIRMLFVDMLTAANGIHDAPEFYNTLTNNCTTRLHDHVNKVSPERVPHGWRIYFPGYADEVIFERGLIDTELNLSEARDRFRINEKARRFAESPDFSMRIREESALHD
ncbi:MAG: DUF4105 domain-containing protein [bacterium]|nr:DUF4105 domain-containing protein [bacterium]